MKKAIVIHNPGSGTSNPKLIEQKVKKQLSSIFKLDYYLTTSFAHLVELCKKANQYDAVIACGGDGTINVVAKHLKNTKIPLGIVPTGSGNGLANTLGLTSVDKALEVIKLQNTSEIDSLIVNNEFSINVSGMGFDAHVAHLFSKEKKRGFWKYLKIVLKEFKHKSYHVEVECNGEQLDTECLLVSFANSNQWGNNVKINSHSSISDGVFEIIILEKIYYWHIPKLIRHLLNGNINQHPKVHIMSGAEAKIKANDVPLHIDGDYHGNVKTEVEVTLSPKSITVFKN